MKNYCVLYCAENQDIAQILKTTLSTDQVNIDLISCQEQQGMSAKLARTASAEAVIALISDNFLKGESCMYQAYELFQQLYHSNRLLSVIIDGKRDGHAVPTSIERVSNVIQYMNYWQEQYLEMRRAHTADETKLNIIRGISSEVGDFLRFLREIDYLPWDQFKANNWQIFAQLSGSYIPFRPEFEVIESSVVSTLSTTLPPTITAVPSKIEKVEALVEALEEEVVVTLPSAATTTSVLENVVAKEAVVAATTISTIVPPTSIEEVHIEAITHDIPGVITFVNDAARGISKPLSSNGVKNKLDNTLPEKLNSKSNEIDEDDFFNKVKEEKKQSDAEHQTLNDMVEEVLREEEQDDQYGVHEIMEIEEEEQDNAASLDYLFDDDDDDDWAVETLASKINGTNSDTSEKTNTPLVAETIVVEDIVPVEAIENHLQPNTATATATAIAEDIEEDNTAILNELEEKLANHVKVASEKPLPSLDLIMTNIQNGNVNEGLAQMHRVLEKEPTNTNLRMHYAILLAKDQNNISGAVEQLEKVLQYDERNTDAYFLLAEIAEMHGDYLQCRSYYEKVAEIDPAYQDIYYKLGILTATHFEKDAADAGTYFKTSLIYNDKNADAAYQYALLLQDKLGKEKKAIKWFHRTLEINPQHPFANYDLAMIHHGRQERAEALDFYLRACDLTPEFQTEANDKAFYYSVLDSTRASEAINLHLGIEDKQMEMQVVSSLEEVSSLELEVSSSEAVPSVSSLDVLSSEVETPNLETVKELETPNPELETPKTAISYRLPKVDTKIALITGATSGIGKATAEAFAKAGFSLILTGRREARLELLQADIQAEFDTHSVVLPFDIRDLSATQSAVEHLDQAWCNVDILINNAGLAKGFDPIHTGNIEDWETMIDTNIKGLLYMTRLISPFMVARKTGHIINLSSTAGKEAYPNGNVYCATKFAVEALTKTMRMDLVAHNIRVSQIAPGHVEETEFALTRFEGNIERAAKVYENFQPLRAIDVAETILFIATRPAHVNIQDILIASTQQASAMMVERSGR